MRKPGLIHFRLRFQILPESEAAFKVFSLNQTDFRFIHQLSTPQRVMAKLSVSGQRHASVPVAMALGLSCIDQRFQMYTQYVSNIVLDSEQRSVACIETLTEISTREVFARGTLASVSQAEILGRVLLPASGCHRTLVFRIADPQYDSHQSWTTARVRDRERVQKRSCCHLRSQRCKN